MAILLEKRNLRGLVIDCLISESHSISTQSTDYPIAKDSSMSDHMVTNPRKISIKGAIHNHQLKNYIGDLAPSNLNSNPLVEAFNERDEGSVEDFQSLVSTIGKSNFGSVLTEFTETGKGERIRAAWARIVEIANNKELCQLVTNLEVYDDMVIESASANHDANNSDFLEFEMTLKKINRVSPRTTEVAGIPVASQGKKDNGDGKVECLTFKDVFIPNAGSSEQNNELERVAVFGSEGRAQRGIINSDSNRVFSPFTQTLWDRKVCGVIAIEQRAQFSNSDLSQGVDRNNSQSLLTELCQRVYLMDTNCFTADFTREFCSEIGGGGDQAVSEKISEQLQERRLISMGFESEVEETPESTGDPRQDSINITNFNERQAERSRVARNYGSEIERDTDSSFNSFSLQDETIGNSVISDPGISQRRLECYRALALAAIYDQASIDTENNFGGEGDQSDLFNLFRLGRIRPI